ncbi:MAG: SDR family NAD(P)-dependent oxidoreductase [Anaerolineales bacterium]|nr:SDR family NAD(P)-dependent oxidoreductase [Anaerolineales bacterium]
MAEIKAASGNAKVDLLTGDLSAQANVHALAEQFKARYERLDVLINNAGLAASERKLTEDGIESNFAVNVVTPYLLTRLLMDSLKKSPSPRVVTLMGGDVPAKVGNG